MVAQLSDDAAYEFWTFDGTVPGPMLRVMEGDRVEITITNPAESMHDHNIDLHAVTGPGGGAEHTHAAPGESASFQFTALNPGVYVYHCATPHVPTHIANGMYGMIVVEPEGGLAPVEKEFYVVQAEVYTNEPVGSSGMHSFSPNKMLAEEPEYILFNGRMGALTGAGALTAAVGDTVRIFFGVGGATPSSFHVIGEVFDRVYLDGDDGVDEPSRNRQTVMVPAAGSVTVEFGVEYPATYVLVDHTLSRTFERGAVGHLVVTGEEDPDIYEPGS
jgi:nitrite reductase (NO-forming)